MQLEAADADPVEYSRLLLELRKIQSWQDWEQVAQACLFLQGNTNPPRMLFNFWNNKIIKNMQDQSYRTQHAKIQDQIHLKAKGLKCTSIDICGLIDCLGTGNLAAVDEGGDEKVGNTVAVNFKVWADSNVPVRTHSVCKY